MRRQPIYGLLAEFETRVVGEVRNVAMVAGNEIVETQRRMPVGEQPVAQMGTNKSGGAGDYDAQISSSRQL